MEERGIDPVTIPAADALTSPRIAVESLLPGQIDPALSSGDTASAADEIGSWDRIIKSARLSQIVAVATIRSSGAPTHGSIAEAIDLVSLSLENRTGYFCSPDQCAIDAGILDGSGVDLVIGAWRDLLSASAESSEGPTGSAFAGASNSPAVAAISLPVVRLIAYIAAQWIRAIKLGIKVRKFRADHEDDGEVWDFDAYALGEPAADLWSDLDGGSSYGGKSRATTLHDQGLSGESQAELDANRAGIMLDRIGSIAADLTGIWMPPSIELETSIVAHPESTIGAPMLGHFAGPKYRRRSTYESSAFLDSDDPGQNKDRALGAPPGSIGPLHLGWESAAWHGGRSGEWEQGEVQWQAIGGYFPSASSVGCQAWQIIECGSPIAGRVNYGVCLEAWQNYSAALAGGILRPLGSGYQGIGPDWSGRPLSTIGAGGSWLAWGRWSGNSAARRHVPRLLELWRAVAPSMGWDPDLARLLRAIVDRDDYLASSMTQIFGSTAIGSDETIAAAAFFVGDPSVTIAAGETGYLGDTKITPASFWRGKNAPANWRAFADPNWTTPHHKNEILIRILRAQERAASWFGSRGPDQAIFAPWVTEPPSRHIWPAAPPEFTGQRRREILTDWINSPSVCAIDPAAIPERNHWDDGLELASAVRAAQKSRGCGSSVVHVDPAMGLAAPAGGGGAMQHALKGSLAAGPPPPSLVPSGLGLSARLPPPLPPFGADADPESKPVLAIAAAGALAWFMLRR